MPRYRFDIHDGMYFPDALGVELNDIGEARRESLRRASVVIDDPVGRFWNGGMWKVSVLDEQGITLFSLNFTATTGLQ